MAFSRAHLDLIAAAVNVNSANYPNDSKLEQQIIYKLSTTGASAAATTLAAPVKSAARVNGGKNV